MSVSPLSASSGTCRSLAQSPRLSALRPQGLPWFSRPRYRVWNSSGKRDSISTPNWRMPMILAMCSLSIGQTSMQAPQVVQSQTSSSLTTSPSSFFRPSGSLRSCPAESSRWCFSLSSRFFGERTLPDWNAGQTSSQRPHSAQEKRSSRSLRVRSVSCGVPNFSCSSRLTRGISALTPMFWKSRLIGPASRCRCLEYMMKTPKAMMTRMCSHQRNFTQKRHGGRRDGGSSRQQAGERPVGQEIAPGRSQGIAS